MSGTRVAPLLHARLAWISRGNVFRLEMLQRDAQRVAARFEPRDREFVHARWCVTLLRVRSGQERRGTQPESQRRASVQRGFRPAALQNSLLPPTITDNARRAMPARRRAPISKAFEYSAASFRNIRANALRAASAPGTPPPQDRPARCALHATPAAPRDR